MKSFDELADDQIISTTIKALKSNNIEAMVVENANDAKEKVLAMLPEGAEVMNMSSITLETLGLDKAINETGKYDAVKPKLAKMDRITQSAEMQKLGSAPLWAVGSVQAITQTGQVIIASNTGSQLPAYAYGSAHVIWVVGTQKIVKDLDEGIKRIYEFVLPLETDHMQKLYKMNSNVSKLLVINKEFMPGRLTVIFVKEKLGF